MDCFLFGESGDQIPPGDKAPSTIATVVSHLKADKHSIVGKPAFLIDLNWDPALPLAVLYRATMQGCQAC